MTAGSIDTTSGASPLAVADAVDEAPRATEDREPTHLEYMPGLDGLRALAVLAVMSGHLPYLSTIRPGWLEGSWLGVSTFFTMSGFLITRLLLAERARRGTVSLGGFWSRRARRLLPALYTCIAFLLLLSVLHVAPPDQQMGQQVLALVLYFKNGLLLYLHGPNGPTFFQMWSLSIEEQFYLLFPLLFLGASMWLRRRAWILFAGIAVIAQLWMFSNNRRGTFGGYVTAYFGTPARSAEVLVGVLLAYLTTSAWWRRAVGVESFKVVRQALGVAGLIGLIYVFRAAVVTWDQTYRWTMLTSLATVAIIIACTTTGGATVLLSCRPLRWIGKVSYGAYVYHLGVFFLLTSGRTGITSNFWLSVVRYVAVFVMAGLSYRYIEAPLRHRTTPRGWRLALAYGSVGALLVLLAFVLPTNEQASVAKATGPFAETNGDATPSASSVVLIGDRSLDASIPGMAALARSETGKYHVGEGRLDGCPLSDPAMVVVHGELRVPSGACIFWQASTNKAHADATAEVVQLGAADLLDQQLADGTLTHLGEPAADNRLRAGLRSIAGSEGDRVRRTWVLLPDDPAAVQKVRLSDTRPATQATPAQERAAAQVGDLTTAELRTRIKRYNELLREVARGRDDITVVGPLTSAASWRAVVGPGSGAG